jgi:transcriptional regulator with XRE-family HTH domain
MRAPEPRLSVDVIRREAQLACEASSLRAVAAEAGMSPMGLRGFIRGETEPQARTIRKLSAWYARRIASRPRDGEAEARAALVLVASLYPPADRSRVETRFLQVMDEEFRESRMEPPAWLQALRAEVQRRTE